jgi:hypothetical protein
LSIDQLSNVVLDLQQSAVKPDVRYKDIMRNLEALNLHLGGKQNEILKQHEIEIANEPIQV